jgi:predicted enzyme related to lactoylglutathione lyase
MIVYVFTEQFDAMKRFYEAVLGIKGRAGGPDWYAFDLGGSKFGLHRQVRDAKKTPTVFHFDLLVRDIDAVVARFRANGAEIVRGVQDEAFGKSAIIRDPEGREMTIVEES